MCYGLDKHASGDKRHVGERATRYWEELLEMGSLNVGPNGFLSKRVGLVY